MGLSRIISSLLHHRHSINEYLIFKKIFLSRNLRWKIPLRQKIRVIMRIISHSRHIGYHDSFIRTLPRIILSILSRSRRMPRAYISHGIGIHFAMHLQLYTGLIFLSMKHSIYAIPRAVSIRAYRSFNSTISAGRLGYLYTATYVI